MSQKVSQSVARTLGLIWRTSPQAELISLQIGADTINGGNQIV